MRSRAPTCPPRHDDRYATDTDRRDADRQPRRPAAEPAARHRRTRRRALHAAGYRARVEDQRRGGARGHRHRRLRHDRGRTGSAARAGSDRPGRLGQARPGEGAARRQDGGVRREPGPGRLPASSRRTAGHRARRRTQGGGGRCTRARADDGTDRPRRRADFQARDAAPGLLGPGEGRRRADDFAVRRREGLGTNRSRT